MKNNTLFCFWLYFMFIFFETHAQNTQKDTLKLNFEEAKKILLQQNLKLISSYYDISLAEADVIQAKLWRNPYFLWNQDMFSIAKNDYFNFQNQFLVQIEQVFSISGKHLWGVRVAKLGIEQNKLQLQDVLRGLLYELGEKYIQLQMTQKKQVLYKQIMEKYNKLIESAENKLRVGAIAKTEVIRLKSERVTILSDEIHNQNEIIEATSSIRQLLNLRENIEIIAQNTLEIKEDDIKIDEVLNQALEARPDIKLAKNNIQTQKANLSLQKAQAMPDLKLGYQPSDKGSNYVRPYQGMVFEMSVPIFDRNQGNIKRAKTQITQAEINQAQVDNTIRNEVANSFSQWINTRKGFQNFTTDLMNDMQEISKNADLNYDNRNINLLQYIDLQRIYTQNQLQYIDLQREY
ncbi:MAG: TolC family protein, partial [Bacteroidetes bacterium]